MRCGPKLTHFPLGYDRLPFGWHGGEAAGTAWSMACLIAIYAPAYFDFLAIMAISATVWAFVAILRASKRALLKRSSGATSAIAQDFAWLCEEGTVHAEPSHALTGPNSVHLQICSALTPDVADKAEEPARQANVNRP